MLGTIATLSVSLLPYIDIPEGHIGPLPIRPFGVLVVIGILLGSRISGGRAKLLGLDAENFSSLLFWTIASGIVISHILDTIVYYPREVLEQPWRLLMIWQGLSSFGGFIGGVVGFYYYAHKQRMDLWKSADALAYGMPFGWLFGRLGCSVVHDHPGRFSDFILAVDFPGGPRFDLGLLEVMLTPVVILAVLLAGRYFRRPGAIVTTLAFVYPFVRFPLDFLRAPAVDGGDIRYLGFTPGHYASVGVLVAAVYMFVRSGAAARATAPASEKAPSHGGRGAHRA